MMTRIYLIFLGMIISSALLAQDVQFKAEVSSDSILMGNYLEVRFTIENAAGDFEAPEFEDFELLFGPNTSSSFSMVNGKVSQKASYTYAIRPLREGILYIDPAVFTSGEEVLETDPIEIEVYPNPAGIEDNKTFGNAEESPFFFEQPKPGKKKEKKSKYKKRKI
jgi:uncharacterized protein (DUF58 family)